MVTDRYVFADEAGNFDFSLSQGASKYFTFSPLSRWPIAESAMTFQSYAAPLAWQGRYLDRVFHVTEDEQAIRDEVFALIAAAAMRIDATILEKRKAQPHLQGERALYQMAWYLHFKHAAERILQPNDRLMVTAASLGTRAKRAIFHRAVDSVTRQVARGIPHRVAFWPAETDPCLRPGEAGAAGTEKSFRPYDPRSDPAFGAVPAGLGARWPPLCDDDDAVVAQARGAHPDGCGGALPVRRSAPGLSFDRAFRRRHLDALAEQFAQALRVGQQAGLVKLGTLSLDGTKLRANASRRKAMREVGEPRFGIALLDDVEDVAHSLSASLSRGLNHAGPSPGPAARTRLRRRRRAL